MRKAIIILSFVLASALPLRNAYSVGSGSYRLEVPDAEALGKGSAFVAQADNPSAVYFNPAGTTQLKGKTYLSIGAAVLQPFCTYKDNSGNETDRRRQIFTIPNAFVVSDFGLEKFSFGLGGTSYWGLGTYWAEDCFSKYVATKTDYSTQDIMLTGAYKINENLSVGAGADYIRSLVNKKKKLLQGGIGDDGDFQLKGKDNSSWGYRLSALYKLNQRHSFGLMYRSSVQVKYKGKIYLNDLNNNSLMRPYNAIFGGTSYQTVATSKQALPQSIVLGYCFKPADKWRLEFDTEWMDWSSVGQEKVDYPAESNPLRLNVLNSGNPVPKDWHAAFAYAVGAEYKITDSLKLRGGYFFHQTPIPEANFETALPDSNSNSMTLGFGIDLNKATTFDFAYAGVFYNERKISNAIGSSSGANINGNYNSFINVYLLTLTFKL